MAHRIFRAQVQLAPGQPMLEMPKVQPLIQAVPPAPTPPMSDPLSALRATSGGAQNIASSVSTSAKDLLSSLIKKDSKLVAAASNQITNRQQQGTTSIKKNKIGRNDPCWCRSGKKWKKCHYPQM